MSDENLRTRMLEDNARLRAENTELRAQLYGYKVGSAVEAAEHDRWRGKAARNASLFRAAQAKKREAVKLADELNLSLWDEAKRAEGAVARLERAEAILRKLVRVHDGDGFTSGFVLDADELTEENPPDTPDMQPKE